MTTFLSIDAGTTALKAALVDVNGNFLALDRQEYRLSTPAPDVVEVDARVIWDACCQAVRNVTAGLADDLAAVCISSQGETLVPVDRAGDPTRHAIVWLDNRATAEAVQIAREFGLARVCAVTGQPEVLPTWPACKVAWIRHHEPDVFARTHKYLLVEDYLIHRMTGRFVTESALQSSSLWLDIHQLTWWRPMLKFVGLTEDHLGDLQHPGDLIGPLSRGGADALGVPPRTVVVSGGLDQTMGAVGAGNIAPGMVSETTGSSLAVVATLARPVEDTHRRVPCFCHSRRGHYVLMPWGQTAGMALRWLRDQFFSAEVHTAAGCADPYALMTEAASQVSAGSDGLVVLPHLEGAACPEQNPAARGVFFGVTLRHTRAHFVRAVMESVAYMLKRNLEMLHNLGVSSDRIYCIGGGARSDLWLQIKADVLQQPVVAAQAEEAACLGAVLTAAVATHHYNDLETAVEHMVRPGRVIEPRPENCPVYEQGYDRYLELYDRLVPMFG